VRAMEPVARYGYLELLLTQWQSEDCSISADPLDLADASGLGDVLWEKLSARIVRNFEILPSGRLRNAVCFEEWQEAKNIFEENRQARSEAGKRGANARWGHADAIAKPSPPMAIAKENHGKKCLTGTVTGTETKGGKGAPLNPDEGSELALAHWLLEECGAVADNGTRRVAAEAIRLLAKEGGTVKSAADFILHAARDALQQGAVINRFWFSDQKYRPQSAKAESPRNIDGLGSRYLRENGST
jgi:hypothetical protein